MATHFKIFSTAVTAAGLRPVDRGRGHWQIAGGPLLVNYYPKKGKIYVAGTVGGFSGSLSDALNAARRPPQVCDQHLRDKRSSKEKNRHTKRQLLKKHKRCRWCRTLLTFKTASIEHIIPLVRGGLNQRNNLTLACKPCNHARGGDMPEILPPTAEQAEI